MFEGFMIAAGASLALYAVVRSADCLIEHSITVAGFMHVPSFLVGVLIVGVGTSSPEAVISLFAGLDGQPSLSTGSAAGSNIINTALLALTMLIYPCLLPSVQAKAILLLLFCLHWLVYFLIDDSLFEFTDAVILFSTGALYIAVSIVLGAVQQYRRRRNSGDSGDSGAMAHGVAQGKSIVFIYVALSLLVLLIGAHFFVGLTVLFCQTIGISDLVIGLTVVAIGTSLPELSASIQAARRGAADIALGNMLGSMTFNLSAVFSFAAVAGDVRLDPLFFSRDFYCLALSFLLCCILYVGGGKPRFLRMLSVLIIALYLVYTFVIVQEQLSV
ncbi:MAG: sodium:calcium antiporter [Gammaproteobacteria bacterium]|nr:sodium:calcium antiporter [Gammaproteobacteria bacterium]